MVAPINAIVLERFDPLTRAQSNQIAELLRVYPDLVVGVIDGGDDQNALSFHERRNMLVRDGVVDVTRIIRIPHVLSGETPLVPSEGKSLIFIKEDNWALIEKLRSGEDISPLVSMLTSEVLHARVLGQYPVFLTGGMGAGKSSVASALSDMAGRFGIPAMHVELDTIGHEIYVSDDPDCARVRMELSRVFGADILDEHGYIVRPRLSAALTLNGVPFASEKMQQLNNIIVPAIMHEYRKRISGFSGLILVDGIVKKGGSPFPALTHHHMLVVDAPEDVRVARVVARDRARNIDRTPENARTMMANQLAGQDITRAHEQKIMEESNPYGSITQFQNTFEQKEDITDATLRGTFFEMLNKVDRYGELRARYVLSLLGIQEWAEEIIRDLRRAHSDHRRVFHTWDRTVYAMGRLFRSGLPDEELAIRAAVLLFGSSRSDFDHGMEVDYGASARFAEECLREHGADESMIVDILSRLRGRGLEG